MIISSENHKPENFTSEEWQQWNSAANTRGQYNAELIADRDRNLKELDGQGQYNAELIADLGRNLKELGPIVQEQFTAHQMKHCIQHSTFNIPLSPGGGPMTSSGAPKWGCSRGRAKDTCVCIAVSARRSLKVKCDHNSRPALQELRLPLPLPTHSSFHIVLLCPSPVRSSPSSACSHLHASPSLCPSFH